MSFRSNLFINLYDCMTEENKEHENVNYVSQKIKQVAWEPAPVKNSVIFFIGAIHILLNFKKRSPITITHVRNCVCTLHKMSVNKLITFICMLMLRKFV